MAERTGVHVNLTGDATQLNASLESAQKELHETGAAGKNAQNALRGVGLGMAGTAAASKRTAKSFGGLNNTVRNASFQFADMAVMLQGGMGVARTFATQLPQLLGGMGVLGAAIGAVVAIGFPMASMFAENDKAADALLSTFGVLEPMMRAIADGMKQVAEIAIDGINLIINNLDRIVITAGVAAAAFAGPMVASFIAAKVAAFGFVGALVALKAALIRTGIGALVVLAGELVYQIFRAVSALGGLGNMFKAFYIIAREALRRTSTAFDYLLVNAELVFVVIKKSVARAADFITRKFVGAFNVVVRNAQGMGGALSAIFNAISQGAVPSIADIQKGFDQALNSSHQFATGSALVLDELDKKILELLIRSNELGSKLFAPIQALKELRAEIAKMKKDDVDIRDIFKGGKGDEDEDGDAKEELERLKEKLASRIEAMKESMNRETLTELELLAIKLQKRQELIDEAHKNEVISEQQKNELIAQAKKSHEDTLEDLRNRARDKELGQIANAFGAIASFTSNHFKRLGKIIKVASAAEALVNAWTAFSQVLRDPTLPWFAKIPAALGVLSAGLGAVNAITSGSKSSSAATSGAAAQPAAPVVSRDVAISVAGGDMFSRDQVIGLINSINEAVEDGARIRLA
jgi:hypothetical protein